MSSYKWKLRAKHLIGGSASKALITERPSLFHWREREGDGMRENITNQLNVESRKRRQLPALNGVVLECG